jgi:hypothetical protein
VRARQVKLATTIHSAIAVIISLAFEQPLIGHFSSPPGKSSYNTGRLRYETAEASIIAIWPLDGNSRDALRRCP